MNAGLSLVNTFIFHFRKINKAAEIFSQPS